MSTVRDILSSKKITKTDKYLLIVGQNASPMSNSEIKEFARLNGWRDGADSFPGSFLSKTESAICLPDGWTLSSKGRSKLEQAKLLSTAGVLTPVTEALEKHIATVKDPDKSRYIWEAVECAKNKCFRASVVLSWVGALYLLYNHIVTKRLKDFNLEVKRQWPTKKEATTIDDLASLKEGDFLSVIEHIGIVTKAECKELTNCLDRRNTAGHPNSHSFQEIVVGGHIQVLINVVYLRF